MRRLLYILLMIIPLAAACSREEEPVSAVPVEPVQEDGAPDGSVKITFSCSMPESTDPTKALGESSELTSMRLAVFGGSGYYKEYVTATLLESHTGEDGQLRTFEDVDGNKYSKRVDYYVFSAELKLSNTPRTIHFLGNGPKSIKIGKANEVLPKLLCNDPDDEFSKETAFWQMIWLPAIKAADDGQGNYYNSQGHIRQPGEDYMVSPDTQAYFENSTTADDKGNVQGGIALIRNWAKIILRNNWLDEEVDDELSTIMGEPGTHGFSNFIPYSFAIVHYPSRGTFVPYGGKTGFIGPTSQDTQDRHYQTLGFEELYYSEKPQNATRTFPFYYGYKGNLPEGTPFNHDVPSEDDFINGTGGVVLYDRTYDSHDGNTGTQWYDTPGANGYNSGNNPDTEPSVYLYERPAPTDGTEPSFVIIYGRYRNPKDPALSSEEKETGVMCYYKIDLMEGNDYYPIFRNFKYQIQLRKITSRGHDNPRSAAESAGSANVSADVTTSTLADISDGKKRMAINPWMSYTFIDGDPDTDDEGNPITELPEHLYVKFIDDITKETPVLNISEESVWAVLSPAGGGVVANDLVEIGPPVLEEGRSDYGWRPIRFKVLSPDPSVSKTQTLRIYCQTDPQDVDEIPLYRDIVLTLQPKQTMKVSCKDRILRDVNTEQKVDITIPAGLVESMFPLIFTIEPQEMTLASEVTTTSDGRQIRMPVVYGGSINPNYQDPDNPDAVLKTRFQFERTITWEEYKAQRTFIDNYDESRWKTFSCYFKTNCEDSATEIWVANKYFNPASCSFSDYRSFKKPRFTTSIPRSMNVDIPVSFGVYKDPGENGVKQYPTVYIELEGLKWENHLQTNGVYSYTPVDNNPSASSQEETLTFKTTTMNGNVSVKLYTEDGLYDPVTIRPWHFRNVGFIEAHTLPGDWTGQWGSNAVFGMANTASGKTIPLGFCIDCDDEDIKNRQPLITYKQVDGNPTSINVSSLNVYNKNLHVSPYSGRDDFYWDSSMKTSGTGNPVWFNMSAVGYVEEEVKAERFVGRLESNRYVQGTFKNWFKDKKTNSGYFAIGDASHNCYVQIEIYDSNGAGPVVTNNGVALEKGKTYDIFVEIREKKANNVYERTGKFELVNVQIDYFVYDDVPQAHLDYEIVSPAEDGNESTFYQYMGANFQYIWEFPRHNQEGHLRLRAPNSRSAEIERIRFWGFQDQS